MAQWEIAYRVTTTGHYLLPSMKKFQPLLPAIFIYDNFSMPKKSADSITPFMQAIPPLPKSLNLYSLPRLPSVRDFFGNLSEGESHTPQSYRFGVTLFSSSKIDNMMSRLCLGHVSNFVVMHGSHLFVHFRNLNTAEKRTSHGTTKVEAICV